MAHLMTLAVVADGPLDVAATLARYRLWGEDPGTRLIGDRLLRVLVLDGRLIPYAIRWRGGVDDVRLTVEAAGLDDPRVRAGVVAEVRRLFGLDFDLPAFYRFAKGDAVLATLVEPLYGLRPTLAPGPLEMLVGSIAAQQVNLAFALSLRARLIRRYGMAARLDGETVHAFPEAAVLARARVRELRALKFSTRKAEYVRGVARALASATLDPRALEALPNESVIQTLTALPGLGRWSAEWFLARCLGRGDVCPAGDLAVRKAFARYYGRGRPLAEPTIRRRARTWGPYQNLAIHYLLAGLRAERARTGGGG